MMIRGGFENDFIILQITILAELFSVFERFTAIGQDFGTSQAVSKVT